MQDDPSKKFSKPVEVKNPRQFEDAERDDRGKRVEAFVQAQQKKEDAAKEQKAKETETVRKPDPPQKNYEMPGPGGAMVRNSVAVENIRRAKVLAAQQKADGLEQEAKRKQAGKETQIKKAGVNPQTKAGTSEKGIEKSAQDAAAQARSISVGMDIVRRAEQLKLAEQGRNLVYSKDGPEK